MPQQHAPPLKLHDFRPNNSLHADVIAGLQRSNKQIPCKYLYDETGSKLFDAICELPEYYPTRTELGIMRRHAAEMVALLGPRVSLIEYGSGSSLKTRILLEHLDNPVAYVPIDISREHLRSSAAALVRRYSDLEVLPVCADYHADFRLPRPQHEARRRVMYFPGSTIGNFSPAAACEFLARMARLCGEDGGLLIGVDLKKDSDVLHAAYNDAQGVTAKFNLNLLRRINRELSARFNLESFQHRAVYNDELGRIEMHLVSSCEQRVPVNGHTFHFASGETIHTESSYKYDVEQFAALAADAGWRLRKVWTDPQELFSVQYLTVR